MGQCNFCVLTFVISDYGLPVHISLNRTILKSIIGLPTRYLSNYQISDTKLMNYQNIGHLIFKNIGGSALVGASNQTCEHEGPQVTIFNQT